MTKLWPFLTLPAWLLLWGCNPSSNQAPPTARPNILFIMSDDHTSQAWGIYGGILKDFVQTPHIQRLADEGLILNNAFCTNAICVPSRGAIMTGQYSHRNGIYTLNDALDPDSMNIAKSLQNAGYQTAIIGKWHLKNRPAGFDHYQVLPGQGVYHNPILKTAADWEAGGREYAGFSSDVIAGLSIEWLKNKTLDKPFFLMTHFKATHEPFDYPERYKDLFEGVEIPEPASLYEFGPVSSGRSFTGQNLEILGRRWERASKNPSEMWTSYPGLPFTTQGLDSLEARRKIYQKFVKDFMRSGSAIDDNIGKLLDYLEEAGLAENTVVIYTADQGYFLGEHGFFDKRMIYEESIRMPFIIRYPKEIKGGARLDDIILNIDFPALFADFAGIDPPGYIQGRSFRENLKGHTPSDWRRSMYYRYWQHRTERPAHFGIRNERYKLAFFYGQPLGMSGAMEEPTAPAWEFYDLKKDPQERHNAIEDPQYQVIIREMKTALQRRREAIGDTDADYPVMQEILTSYWE
jgi:arylsulfatase A-like enzyme